MGYLFLAAALRSRGGEYLGGQLPVLALVRDRAEKENQRQLHHPFRAATLAPSLEAVLTGADTLYLTLPFQLSSRTSVSATFCATLIGKLSYGIIILGRLM